MPTLCKVSMSPGNVEWGMGNRESPVGDQGSYVTSISRLKDAKLAIMEVAGSYKAHL